MTNSSGRPRVDEKPRFRVQWRKSSYSNNGGSCVQIGVSDDTSVVAHKANSETLYLVRDSKNPDGRVLAFTPAEWGAFLVGLKNSDFDGLT
jgi:hypothetical protein